MRQWLNDLRFWMVVVFLLQLPFITQPPIDSSHTWRQTLTGTVARNMANGEGNLFYPVIDHNGASTGIIGMEFPVYNAAIAGMIKVFGFRHWYGRLINLLLTLLGVFCFSKLVEAISDKRTAFWSGLLLLCSLWLIFMRKIMPDTLSVSLVLTGVWLGYRYLLGKNMLNAIGYFALVSLGLLSKIPAAVVLAPFGLMVYITTVPYGRKALIVGLTFISVVLLTFWYFVWVPQLVSTYEYPLYFTRDLATGLIELSLEKGLILSQFLFNSFYSYLTFALVVVGLFLASANKEKRIVLAGVISAGIFFYFIIKTGMVFPKHNYYMIPIIPAMAMFAGYGIAHFPYKKWVPFVVSLLVIESLANMQHDVHPKNKWYTGLESKMNEFSTRSDLVLCNGGVGPQMMYFMNRRGWTMNTDVITIEKVEMLRSEGAIWLVMKKPYDPSVYKNYDVVYRDDHVDVFHLIKD